MRLKIVRGSVEYENGGIVRGNVEFENGDKLGTASILRYSEAYRSRQ